MADNKRRGRFGRGSQDDESQSIFDLFEPPPEQDNTNSFSKIPIIRDDEDSLDLTDGEFVEAKAAAEAEAAGLAHWSEPATGQIPASLGVDRPDRDITDVKGPSWRGEDPNWAGPDLSDVFADTEAITHDRLVDVDEDDLGPQPPPQPRRAERPAAPIARGATSTPPAPSVFDRPAGSRSVSTPPVPPSVNAQTRPPRAEPSSRRPAAADEAGGGVVRGRAAVPPPVRDGGPAAGGAVLPPPIDAVARQEATLFGVEPKPPKRRGAHDLPNHPPDGGAPMAQAAVPEGPVGRSRATTTDPGELGEVEMIDPHEHPDPDQVDERGLLVGDGEEYEYDDYDEYDYDYDEGGRSLVQSVVVGLALAAIVFVTLGFGPVPTMVLICILTLVAVMELFNSMRVAGLRPATLLGLVGAVALPAATFVRGEAGYPLVVGLAVVFGMLWYLTGADTERPVLNLGLTLTGVLWVGGLAGFGALMLREEGGLGLLLAAILITATSDTLAYLGGKAYGTKSFHSASPNKTREGTLTGFFGALFAGLAIGVTDFITVFDGQFISVLVLAAVVGVLAPIGDLAESLVKRDLGIKDMGTLLPGHGGVLDRIDGLLFALPGAYYVAVIYQLIGS